MPKQLRFEVFTASTDQFKEQTLGATPSLYQGSPAELAFAFFDGAAALLPLAARYTDVTLEVWEDQDAGARRLQKTIASAEFDATCTLADWNAKTKAPVVFDLSGAELDLAIPAGKTSRTFYMVVGGTPIDGEPETLGYATLQMLKDRFGEPSDPVVADPATYLSAAQSDARYARLAPAGGAYRIKDGVYLQVKNATTGTWHTVFATGAAGAEVLTLGPAEA